MIPLKKEDHRVLIKKKILNLINTSIFVETIIHENKIRRTVQGFETFRN